MRRAALALTLAIPLAACGGTTASHPRASGGRSHVAPSAQPAGSRLLLDAAQPFSVAYAVGRSLYYPSTSPVGQHTGLSYELTRIDTASGRVMATRLFSDAIAGTLVAQGSLWVTSTRETRTTLWRLDPRSLRVRSAQTIPSTPAAQGIAGSLAEAGGQLWVGTGKLIRVSLHSARVDRVIDPPHPGPIQLAADSRGRILLASLGYEHPTYIARLNPETGTPVAELTVAQSDSQPVLGGVVDGGAWVSNTVGSRTSAWRVSVAPLAVAAASDRITHAGRISVRAIDGALWVTEPLGQDNLNYCANPVSGQPIVRLPPLPGNSVFLTADGTNFFYTDVPLNAHTVKLEIAPINRRCLS